MSDSELREFMQKHKFVLSPKYSIPEKGMSSRVDAYASGNVLLRIVVDRGQRFIDLARFGTDVWIDVFSLASRADKSFVAKTGSFEEGVRALTTHWPEIVVELLKDDCPKGSEK